MKDPTFLGKLQRKENHEGVLTCLNEDVILNILYKLPYKSQLRFCTVSRSWFDLIANPNRQDSCYSFSLKKHPTLLGLFYDNYEPDTRCVKWKWISVNQLASLPESCLPILNKPSTNNGMRLKASSNGYLLCHHAERCDPGPGERFPTSLHCFNVVNPFTRQEIVIPKVKKTMPGAHVAFVCFIDDKAAWPVGPIRFTVVPIDNQFTQRGFDVDVKVFSSNHGQWREFQLKAINPPRDDKCISSIGYFYPGIVVGGRLFYWFCNTNNYLLVFDLDNLEIVTMELPHDHYRYENFAIPPLLKVGDTAYGYDYRALCVFQDSLFYGIQYKVEKIIQVFIYDGDLRDFRNGGWVWKYKVCLAELEQKLREIMNVIPSESEGNSLNLSSLVYYKGFHPRNPEIIFLVIQGKFMSYEVKCQKLVVHTADDEDVPLSSYGRELSHGRNWVTYESWAWQHSLPRIPQQ